MPPVVIADRYAVVRRLASGGMGDIFLAHQTGMANIKRLVIIKTLRTDLASDPSFLEQFLDEARVAATLNHPNIVGIYEVGHFQGLHFIAMEYIAGVDLADLLQQAADHGQAVPWRVAASIVKDAALGLDAAHNARDEAGRRLAVVHRDVSPHNIMVRADGVVKVVDFGIAQAATQEHETQSNQIKGKVRYMPPEQISGRPLDGRADQFALAVVLWEMCAGRRLFLSDNPIDIYERTMTGKIPRLTEADPSLPGALADIVGRALSASRDDRYPHCADFSHAIAGVLEGHARSASHEVAAFVEEVAGPAIAERVRDLSPQQVSLHGPEHRCAACGHVQAASLRFCGACGGAMVAVPAPSVPTQSLLRGSHGSKPTKPELPSVQQGAVSSDQLAIDVSLFTSEISLVAPARARELIAVAALLPSWKQLLTDVENQPMGAFGATRLRRTLLRQLDTLAATYDGVFAAKTPERLLVVFGLDGHRPDDADRAMRFALDWRTALSDFSGSARTVLRAHIAIVQGLADVLTTPGAPALVTGPIVDAAFALADEGMERACSLLVSAALAPPLVGRFSLDEPATAGSAWEYAGGEVQMSQKISAPLRTRKRVLIVDDSAVFRRVEHETLRKLEVTALEAKDGEEALRLALQHVPDLILLDLHMPKMTGLEVLTALRHNDTTKNIPVIVVSTLSRSTEKTAFEALGVTVYVDKPVVPATLLDAVRTVLDAPPARSG